MATILNGRVLAISSESDTNVVVSSLRKAKEDSSLNGISLHAINLDQLTLCALIELIRQNNNKDWDSVELINCRGRVDMAIIAALSKQSLSSLSLVRNIENDSGGSSSYYRALGMGLIASPPTLRNLRLTSTIGTEDAAKSLAVGIQRNSTLEVLEFRWCHFEDETSIIELSNGLSGNKHLKKLDFYGCSLEDDDVAQVATSLKHHPTLATLVLNGNKCGELANQQISALLSNSQSPSCVLKYLDLSFQRPDNGHRFHSSMIIEALHKNKSIHTIDMTNCGLGDEEIEMIAGMLCVNNTMKELLVARNKISDVGITAFASNLPKMEGLQKLSLWGNTFGEEGAVCLLNGMKMNTEIEDMDTFRQFDCSDRIQYYTNVNRGGRRLLTTTKNVPLALWSLVLDRANHVKLTKQRGQDVENARADTIFCLLQGPALVARSNENR